MTAPEHTYDAQCMVHRVFLDQTDVGCARCGESHGWEWVPCPGAMVCPALPDQRRHIFPIERPEPPEPPEPLGPQLATADDVIARRATYNDTPGGHADRHAATEPPPEVPC